MQPALRDDPDIDLDLKGAGYLLAFGNGAYVIGKFVNGPLVDRFGTRACGQGVEGGVGGDDWSRTKVGGRLRC